MYLDKSNYTSVASSSIEYKRLQNAYLSLSFSKRKYLKENASTFENLDPCFKYGIYDLDDMGDVLANLVSQFESDDEKRVFTKVKQSDPNSRIENHLAVILKENDCDKVVLEYIPSNHIEISKSCGCERIPFIPLNNDVQLATIFSTYKDGSNINVCGYEVVNKELPNYLKDFIVFVTKYRFENDLEKIDKEQLEYLEHEFIANNISEYKGKTKLYKRFNPNSN